MTKEAKRDSEAYSQKMTESKNELTELKDELNN